MVGYSFEQSVKIISGKNSITKIGELLRQCGYQKPFIVYDTGLKKAGVVDTLTDVLKAADIPFVTFDKVTPDPPTTVVDEGAELCRANQCDCVIGIGGGSPMDTAKAINILRFNEGKIVQYFGKSVKDSKGLILIPTTSGTGSELSPMSVITEPNLNKKYGVSAKNAMAEYAILDACLTLGIPQRTTVATALDAFSHAAEGYVSILSNPMTDLICEKIMETVVSYLPAAVEDPKDSDAREKLQCAATLSGFTLTHNAVNVGHSVAHVLGAEYHVMHGEACAYGFVGVFKEMAKVRPDKVRWIATVLGAQKSKMESPKEIGQALEEAYHAFCQMVGLAPLASYALENVDIDAIAELIAQEPCCKLTPFSVTKDVALELAKSSLCV